MPYIHWLLQSKWFWCSERTRDFYGEHWCTFDSLHFSQSFMITYLNGIFGQTIQIWSWTRPKVHFQTTWSWTKTFGLKKRCHMSHVSHATCLKTSDTDSDMEKLRTRVSAHLWSYPTYTGFYSHNNVPARPLVRSIELEKTLSDKLLIWTRNNQLRVFISIFE